VPAVSARGPASSPDRLRPTEVIGLERNGRLTRRCSRAGGPRRVLGTPRLNSPVPYQHIWQDTERGGTLREHLRTRGKRYRK